MYLITLCIWKKHVVYLHIYETQLYAENLQHTRCETADASNNSHWIRNRINQTFESRCFTPPCTSNSFVSVHVTVSIYFSVIQRTCDTHDVELQMHPSFMLKSSLSWFDVSLYQNVSDTSFPNHPGMIVEAKCARGNVSLCCLSKTHHHSLHLGSWIFLFLVLSQVSKWPFRNQWTFKLVIKSHTIAMLWH